MQTPINISLVKEQTEHNICEVCINSLDWYDASTVKNKIKKQINIASQRTTMSNAIIHTHTIYTEKQSEKQYTSKALAAIKP